MLWCYLVIDKSRIIMSSHDEYSSDEEDVDATTKSSVFLGFVDAEINNEEDEPTVEDTFIGGQPVWLDPENPPADDLLICKNCQSPLALLLQAFAPLEGALYDRVVYVLGCKKSECNRAPGSVRAIRGVLKDPKRIAELEKQQEEELKSQLDEKLKLENQRNYLFDEKKTGSTETNPFSASGSNPFSSSSTDSNPFSASPFDQKKVDEKPTFSSIASKAAPPKPQPKKSTLAKKLPEYPGYFAYVDPEKFNKKPQSKKLPENMNISDSALDLDEVGSSSGKERELNPEAQAISAGLDDKVFQHFSDIVEYNPGQILRYDLGGKPLLFSSKDDTAKKVSKNLVPNPPYNPSSTRHFELQLMPKAILDLEKGETAITGGIEWGTIIVYTDVEDYMPGLTETQHVGYVEEWVGVQWEELITRRT